MVEAVTDEDLLVRMVACHHRINCAMHNMGAFEECSPLQILAVRAMARAPHAMGAADFARALGCSLPHASRLAKALKDRGLVTEHRWRQFRSLVLTEAGRAWVDGELPYLSAFARQTFARIPVSQRDVFFELLGRATP